MLIFFSFVLFPKENLTLLWTSLDNIRKTFSIRYGFGGMQPLTFQVSILDILLRQLGSVRGEVKFFLI